MMATHRARVQGYLVLAVIQLVQRAMSSATHLSARLRGSRRVSHVRRIPRPLGGITSRDRRKRLPRTRSWRRASGAACLVAADRVHEGALALRDDVTEAVCASAEQALAEIVA
jgi:hypothetical protein